VRCAHGQKKRRHKICKDTRNKPSLRLRAHFVPSFFLPSSLRSGTINAIRKKAFIVPSLRLEKCTPFFSRYRFNIRFSDKLPKIAPVSVLTLQTPPHFKEMRGGLPFVARGARRYKFKLLLAQTWKR